MSNKPKTLSAPLRVYWVLAPEDEGGLESGLAVKVSAELAALKVFFVTLRLASGKRADLHNIIGAMKPGVRVTVSFGGADSLPDTASIDAADGLDIMPDTAEGLSELIGRLAEAVPDGKPLSVSVVPSRDNLRFIDKVLDVSVRAGVRTFNLPNPDITRPDAAGAGFALDSGTRAGLKSIIEGRLGPLGAKARLNVHDLFLHKELRLPGLGGRIEYAGCQAGDALAFIDQTGLVYPCSTWPEPLGRLGVCSFGEIWASEVRHAIRDMVSSLPGECEPCPEAPDCKGGCMGMAHALGRPGGKDPGCDR